MNQIIPLRLGLSISSAEYAHLRNEHSGVATRHDERRFVGITVDVLRFASFTSESLNESEIRDPGLGAHSMPYCKTSSIRAGMAERFAKHQGCGSDSPSLIAPALDLHLDL